MTASKAILLLGAGNNECVQRLKRDAVFIQRTHHHTYRAGLLGLLVVFHIYLPLLDTLILKHANGVSSQQQQQQ